MRRTINDFAPEVLRAAIRGLMKPMDGDEWGKNMTYFILTPEGKNVAMSLTPEYWK